MVNYTGATTIKETSFRILVKAFRTMLKQGLMHVHGSDAFIESCMLPVQMKG